MDKTITDLLNELALKHYEETGERIEYVTFRWTENMIGYRLYETSLNIKRLNKSVS